MKLVNEVADLLNKLSSAIDDVSQVHPHDGILLTQVNEGGTSAMLSVNYFVDTFPTTSYSVIHKATGIPYRLSRVIDGVEFYALVDYQSLQVLNITHEDHYMYISQVSLC